MKMIGDLAYMDASALLKLISHEPETMPLRRELMKWPRLVASAVVVTEVSRAVLRVAPALLPQVNALLARVEQLIVSRARLQEAASLHPPLMRSLDAIHVATALAIGPRVGALITYDQRMATAAAWHGLKVLSPS